MSLITTGDAAIALRVTPHRVGELARSGRLEGRRLGRNWVIDEQSLAAFRATRQGAGREWSRETSWAVLLELAGIRTSATSASTNARIRRRLRDIDGEAIASKVATRTVAHRYAADDLEATVEGLILTGRSAMGEVSDDLAGGVRGVEGYVRSGSLTDFVRKNLMLEDSAGEVTIYEKTTDHAIGDVHALRSIAAADLARSSNSRERAAGCEALEEMRIAWLAKHTA